MSKQEKKTNKLSLKWICFGSLVGLAVMVLTLLLGAALISKETLPETLANTIVCFGALIGAFFGGIFAGRKNKCAYIPCGLVVGGVLFLLRTVIAAFGDGQIFDRTSLLLLLSLLAGGAFGGLLAQKRRKKRKK